MLAYHYTTIDTLDKMLVETNGDVPFFSMRATQCNYLHDIAENTLGRYLLPRYISRIEQELGVPQEKALAGMVNDEGYMNYILSGVKNFDDHWFGMETFILSFSECQDSLNLWTLYGGAGTGLALCFDMDLMQPDYSKYFNVSTKKCKYWSKETLNGDNPMTDTELYEEIKSMYKAVTNPKVLATYGKIYESEGSGNVRLRIVNTIVSNLVADFGIFNKMDDWKEEKEVRLSLAAVTPDFIYYKRKEKDMDYVPAVEVKFPIHALKGIVIGPKCGKNTYGMIQSLFYKRGLYNRDLQILNSSCPLR